MLVNKIECYILFKFVYFFKFVSIQIINTTNLYIHNIVTNVSIQKCFKKWN